MPKETTTTSITKPKTASNQKASTTTATTSKTQPKKQGSVKVDSQAAKNLKNPVKGTNTQAPVNKNAKNATKNTKNTTETTITTTNAKPNRMANVEKGDAANKGTAYIGATFNVNSARKAIRSYITTNLDLDLGMINAQYAYTAAAEVIALHIVRSSAKFTTKSAKKADLYEVTLENIQRAIRESVEYGPEIKSLVDSYNPTAMNYISTFFDTEKVLRTFLETKSFTNIANVHVNDAALNFVCYILSHMMCNLTRACCILSQHANKANIQIKNFRFATELYIKGELRELLIQRISDVEALFSNKKGEDGEEEEEDAKSINTKGKKPTKPAPKKTGSKKVAKDEEEDEDEEEEEEEDEEEEEEEEDEE